jgi:hypothetical protein
MSDEKFAFEPVDQKDADYWMKMVKCQDACPVHTNACGYVTAIAEGRDLERQILSLRSADGFAARPARPTAAAVRSIRRSRFAL